MKRNNKIIFGFLMSLVLMASIAAAIEVKLINTDPYPLNSGDYAKARIGIFNNEPTDTDGTVTVEFLDSFPFRLADETQRSRSFRMIADHSDEFYQLVEYDVFVEGDAPDGSATLKFRIPGSSGAIIYTVPVSVSHEIPHFEIGSIKTIPEKVYPDTDDVKVEVQITNVGDNDAKAVTVEAGTDAGEPSNVLSDRSSIGTIKESESAIATFYFDVPADVEAGAHYANVTIRYVEDNDPNNRVQETMFSGQFFIVGKPEFSVDSVILEPTGQGDSGEMKFRVSNTGSEKAERVSVDVVRDSDVDIDFDKYTSYVGDLDSGESGEAYYAYSVGRGAEVKNNQVILSVRYVFDGKTYTETFPVGIEVLEREESFFENKTYMGGMVVVLIVAGFLLRRQVKKKKETVAKKKDEEKN